ncbi:sigma 54-interacting transcriptional regulator [Spirosoma linguale]|uniref:sigma 54-interacting transcriptional regulator n=1 Tax=Spirosoma linguale TaxID=108 RepID=UPI0001A3C9C9
MQRSNELFIGESGTGKELIARALHNRSPRKDKVLVKLNCATLSATLIESELFGHERVAFTGAIDKRIGKFELANGGTLFLDEIGEIPLELQPKLLRVLQEKEYERLGPNKLLKTDVRIIVVNNRDLEKEVADGRFRLDLFYRLSVFPIHLPPLRDRRDDIPLLAMYFARKFCRQMGKPFRGIANNALSVLMHYHWPGNIRELENVVQQSVIINDGPTDTC